MDGGEGRVREPTQRVGWESVGCLLQLLPMTPPPKPAQSMAGIEAAIPNPSCDFGIKVNHTQKMLIRDHK